MKIGLYFGSFNPIHIGHLIIANHIQQHTDLEKVMFVVSPHNPHKKKSSLANDYERLHMVNLAITDYPSLLSSDIEFKMPQPSYTIDTLTALKEKHPKHDFCLIMGMDNLQSFHKWKNHLQIINQHQIYVCNRKGATAGEFKNHHQVNIIDAPLIEISSTFIRAQIKNQKNTKPMLPPEVWEYLDGSSLYQ